MSRGSPSDEIPLLIVKGIEQAQKMYSLWSSDERWLDDAPEFFVSVKIAEQLFKKLQCPVRMEYPVKKSNDSRKPGRKRNTLRIKGRFDILVSRKSVISQRTGERKPWCPIEVKSPVWSVSKGLVCDIERIRDKVAERHHEGGVSCGAIAFYSSVMPRNKDVSPSEALDELQRKIDKAVKSTLGVKSDELSYKIYKSKLHEGDYGNGWRAYCIFIKARKARASTPAG